MTALATQGRPSGMRDELRALSTSAPGLTGIFLDSSGVLTVAVATDKFSAGSMANVLAWARAYGAPSATLGEMRTRRVRYSFLELDTQYRVLEATMRSDDGVSLTAIDESRGVIVVGTVSTAKGDGLRSRLVASGIPADMLVFERARPGAGESTLQDPVRPTIGGLRVVPHANQGCTLGFNLMRWADGIDPPTSPKYFMTAGHCNGFTWGTNTQLPYYQVADRVGEEFEAVPIFNYPSWHCPAGKTPCTEADAVFIKYDDTVSVAYGNVARVSALNGNIIGYTNVQPNYVGAMIGQKVTKVGQATGSSTGTVSLTCADFQVGNGFLMVWVKCMGRANYNSGPGDSGAPVFIPSSGSTSMKWMSGIHSASDGTYRYFSRMDQIDWAVNGAYFYW